MSGNGIEKLVDIHGLSDEVDAVHFFHAISGAAVGGGNHDGNLFEAVLRELTPAEIPAAHAGQRHPNA